MERGNNTTTSELDIIKKYPDLLISLNCLNVRSLHNKRRMLRYNSERMKKLKLIKKLRWKQFESALFDAMTNNKITQLFNCPMCRSLLKVPITVQCGHTFCANCLNQSLLNNTTMKCVICLTEIDSVRCTNVLIQDIVEKWRERNKYRQDCTIPNASDILGIELRYHLRSGYTGLQINPNNNLDIDMSLLQNNLKINTNLRKISNKKFNTTLANVFQEIDDIKEKAFKESWEHTTINDLECILCSRCILDPVTTACGHTFCRCCLTRVLDHGLSCPLCMATLTVSDYSRGSTVALDQAIRFLVPNDYNERLSIHLQENEVHRNSDFPVFICTNAFPGVACPLYVYEPRYRLLVRRCLMSPTRRFAMAAKASNGEKFAAFGTVLEVKDAVYLEDGRFILTTVGVRRFRVISRGEQDGYDTAKIQYIKDTGISADKVAEILQLHQKVYMKASKWIMSLRPKVLSEVERLIGHMPQVEKNWIILPDGPSWTWWLMPILPLSSQLQIGFLRTATLEKRLRAIDKMLDHMKVRMKALERNTLNCSLSEDTSESCSDSERTFEISLTDD